MKLKISKLKLVIITILIGLPSLSIAQRGGGMGLERGMFWGADLNRNGCLDRDEAKAVHNLGEDEIFERYDKDANNCISFTEFREFMQQAPWTKPFVPPGDQEY